MKRLAWIGLALVAGCAWSNSLYQARHLTEDALRAERDNRPGEATQIWGQVTSKAESAYARSPRGARGAEALWLAGNAEAHGQRCGQAAPYLERSLLLGPRERWTEQLLLELGQCQETVGGPTAASVYAMLESSADPAIRRKARLRRGHVLVQQQQWAEGAAALEGQDTLPARVDRAMALIHLGRADEALANLAPVLAASDTSIHWLDFVETFAAHDTPATDQLLTRLLAFPKVNDEQRSAWLFAGAKAAMEFDPAATDRRLALLATRPRGHSVTEGRMLGVERQLLGARSVAEVRSVVDSIQGAGELPEGSLEATRVAVLQASGRRIVNTNDSTRAGAPTGDLTVFALAEFARDSFGAPRLAGWLFARVERNWPNSMYLPKALMARASLEPDSATMLLARARRDSANPYIAAANGELGGQARVAQLEDSLGRFIRTLWARLPAAPRIVQDRE